MLSKTFKPLMLAYFLASLAHFVHNAEYIAYYPNMPRGLTREHVYLVWVAITAVGLLGLVLTRMRLPVPGLALMGLYGAFGLDGLAHYTLALCSEHSLVANVTIWSEASTGLALLLVCAVLAVRHGAQGARPR